MRMRKYKKLVIPGKKTTSSTAAPQTTTESHRPGRIFTTGGNSNGAPCYFPFVFNGKKYYKCYGRGRNAWCGTTFNYDKDQKWGFCSSDGISTSRKTTTETTTVLTTKPGSSPDLGDCQSRMPIIGGGECVFPFKYNGRTIWKCLGRGTQSWCSRTYDFDNDRDWGYCDLTNEIKCLTTVISTTSATSQTSTVSAKTQKITTRGIADESECVDTMPTYGGNSDGAPCVFPYVHGDRVYNTCQGPKTRAWCSTTYNFELDRKWGYCDFQKQINCTTLVTATPYVEICIPKLPTKGGNSKGKPCVFPYIYLNENHTECQVGAQRWCATTENYDNDKMWGICDFENEITCNMSTVDIITLTSPFVRTDSPTITNQWITPCVSVIPTFDGNSNNAPCHFPFLYAGEEFIKCDDSGIKPWCGTTYDYDADGKWGFCDFENAVNCSNTVFPTPTKQSTVSLRPVSVTDNCIPQIWTTDGVKCRFPFSYGGEEYNKCIEDIGYTWCATTYDFDYDDEWGYCDLESEVKCPTVSPSPELPVTKKPPSPEPPVTEKPGTKFSKSPTVSTTRGSGTDSCFPQIWTTDGVKCRFPFSYGGEEYNKCIEDIGYTWCATTYDFDYDDEWGYCDLESEIKCPTLSPSSEPPVTKKPPSPEPPITKRPGTKSTKSTTFSSTTGSGTDSCIPQIWTTDGVKCRFPFSYGGEEYNKCIEDIGYTWCATTYDFDYDDEWGYCDLESETKCPALSPSSEPPVTKKPPSPESPVTEKPGTKSTKSTTFSTTTGSGTDSCILQIWTTDGVKCRFPFSYGGEEYNKCIEDIGYTWCATTYDFDYDDEWGYCDLESEIKCPGVSPSSEPPVTKRPVTKSMKSTTVSTTRASGTDSCIPQIWTTDGVKCRFPFSYGGEEYNKCIEDIGYTWCATTYDFDYDDEWGYCDLESEIKCPGLSPSPKPPVTKRPVTKSTKSTTFSTTRGSGTASCIPQIWTTDGVKCRFPFSYGGEEYNKCIEDIGYTWCATTYDFDYDDEWGYCDLESEIKCLGVSPSPEPPVTKRPVTKSTKSTTFSTTRGSGTASCIPQIWTTDGVKCRFPFSYGGEEYNKCIEDIGYTWCATTYDFDYDDEWGYCDLESEIKCLGVSPSPEPPVTKRPVTKSTKSTTVSTTRGSGTASCIPQIWTTDGVKCRFPFSYGGEEYNKCIEDIGYTWCATTYDFDYDDEWGYCDLESEIKCLGVSPSPEPPVTKRPVTKSTKSTTVSTTRGSGTDSCIPQIWTTDGVKCRFPFSYGGEEYNKCIEDIGYTWCATTYDFDYDDEWGYCDLESEIKCPGLSPSTEPPVTKRRVTKSTKLTTVTERLIDDNSRKETEKCLPKMPTTDNSVCHFPFLYGGIEYNECYDGWCGTTYNYDEEALWGYCDFAREVKCKTSESHMLKTTPNAASTEEEYDYEYDSALTTTPSTTSTAVADDYDYYDRDYDNNDKESVETGECKITTIDGRECALPFLYSGTEYNECYDGWCSVTYNYDVDGLWGYCNPITEGNCAKKRKKREIDWALYSYVDQEENDYKGEKHIFLFIH